MRLCARPSGWRRHLPALPCLLAGLLAGSVALAGDGPEKPAAAEVQNVLFLGPTAPLLLRLHIDIDGKPFRARHRAAWDSYDRALFRHLDRDRDGRLTEAEARRMPPPPRFGHFPGLTSAVSVAFNFRVVDADGDGKVSPGELAAFHREYGGAAFQSEFRPGNPVQSGVTGQAISGLLDTDKDGELSAAELKKAEAVLFRRDADGDGILTAAELTDRPTPTTFAPPTSGADDPFLFLTPETVDDLPRRLLARYGAPTSSAALTRKALGLSAAAFARLDRDHDGKLDGGELRSFPDKRADLELRLHLGSRKPGQPTVEILHSPDGKGPGIPRVWKSGPDSVVLAADGARIEWRIRPEAPAPNPVARRQRLDEFRAAARKHGFLTSRDARRADFFPNLFDLLDADGDDKLTAREFTRFLDRVQEAQGQAVAAAVAVEVSAEGAGLFDLLDRNRDGRLGLREVRGITRLLKEQPPGGKKVLPLSGLPHSYQLSVGLGRGNLSGKERLDLAGMPLLDLRWSRPGLVWFDKMDRNRDGDVSPSEFLGTAEHFRKLDADGDGLIDRAEAARAADLFRK
jgi:Ca2+-binding EF-hand superfamily protein